MRRFVLLAALLVVAAGCNAPGSPATDTPNPASNTPVPTTDATPSAQPTTEPTSDDGTTDATPSARTETATPSADRLASGYTFSPEGGEFPFDHRLTFARTALLLDRPDAEPPGTVLIQPREDVTFPTTSSDFTRTLRLGEPPEAAVLPAFTNGETITMSAELNERPAFAEATFAQESAHVVQFGENVDRRLQREVVSGPRPTVDEAQVIRSVFEGAAVYTEAAYQRQYLDRDRTRIGSLRAEYLNATGSARISFGLYHFGTQYVADRVDEPADTWDVYDSPPETTEQLLHGQTPDEEPVRDVDVTAETDRYGEVTRAETRMGELFLRTTLATNLSESVAARGADGWGTDRRLVFTPPEGDDPTAYAWVHRWDDPSNATEFRAVMGAYLNATADRRVERVDGTRRVVWTAGDDRYRLVRVAPETTVLLMGDAAFVRNATVTGSNAAVRLTTNGSAADLASDPTVGVVGSSDPVVSSVVSVSSAPVSTPASVAARARR